MRDNYTKAGELAFTSRNEEVLLIHGGNILSAATVEEAEGMLRQLKAAIGSASVTRIRTREATTEKG